MLRFLTKRLKWELLLRFEHLSLCILCLPANSAIWIYRPVAVWFRTIVWLNLSSRSFQGIWISGANKQVCCDYWQSALSMGFVCWFTHSAWAIQLQHLIVIHIRRELESREEGCTRVLKCSRTFWLLCWLLRNRATFTQGLVLTLGFKTDIIHRMGEQRVIHGSDDTGMCGGCKRLCDWSLSEC